MVKRKYISVEPFLFLCILFTFKSNIAVLKSSIPTKQFNMTKQHVEPIKVNDDTFFFCISYYSFTNDQSLLKNIKIEKK